MGLVGQEELARIAIDHPWATILAQEVLLPPRHADRIVGVVVAGGHEETHAIAALVTVEDARDGLAGGLLPVVGEVAGEDHQSDAPTGHIVEDGPESEVVLVEQAGRPCLRLPRTHQLGMALNVLDMRIGDDGHALCMAPYGESEPQENAEYDPIWFHCCDLFFYFITNCRINLIYF